MYEYGWASGGPGPGISWAIQGSFANCNISVDLDLFNEGITEYI